MLHFPMSPRVLLASALLLAGCGPALKPVAPKAVTPALARAHFVAPDGAVLPVRAWLPANGPPKAAIVAVHGFNDYSRAFELPGRHLRSQGLAVYAYDQRGFGNAPGRGRWAGAEAYAADLRAFTGEIRRKHPGLPVYVLGESMGGAVAIVAMAAEQPPAADGVILSAPAVWARESMPWYQRALLAVTESTVPDLELTGGGLGVQASDNIEVLRGLGRDPLVIKATRVSAISGLADLMDAAQARAGRIRTPVLVLYGEKDEVIPKEPIAAMVKKLPARQGNRVGIYPAGYHLLLRDLHADRPEADIAAWIEDHARPLPSGSDRSAPAAGSLASSAAPRAAP
jgi:alpha-beta hydrolase superfamily lysophospholipase